MLVLLSIATVLVCILVFRLHAFLTLLLAGLLVAVCSSGTVLETYLDFELTRGTLSQEQVDQIASRSPASRLAYAFGETAGKIGILIGLASIVGQCLLESKAASVIVDRLLKLTGNKRAPEAIAASAFVLAIPVFFDTVFYLMMPLARSLRQRVGKDYVLFVLAILAGGSIAHSLIPPTPGPLLVAGILNVEIGTMMIAGLSIGLCSSVLSLMAARVINHFVDVPLRPVADDDAADSADTTASPEEESATSKGPSLIDSLLPIVLPVLLIGAGSVVSYLVKSGTINPGPIVDVLRGLGDKNIALGIGLVAAIRLVKYVAPNKRKTIVNRSLASAGSIILITSAGGAFGMMLRQAGIEQLVTSLAGGATGLLILPIAFLVTTAIRTLQGSATVAMITSAGVLQGFAAAESLSFHPVYLAMAIGAGSKPISWMTDSAFWIITRMTGMTESEGLKTISPMSIALGLSAISVTIFFAWCFPAI